MTGYWPWYLGGVGLALVAGAHLLVTRRLLGVSGSFAGALEPSSSGAMPDPQDFAELEAAMMAATREEFGDGAVAAAETAPEPAPLMPTILAPAPPLSWAAHIVLLGGVLVGALIAALSHRSFAITTTLGDDFDRLIVGGAPGWVGYVALAAGGLMVGFGTAMAGGCTSGHGLCGTSRLQRGSLVATGCFFGAAVIVSLALDWVRR